jgi:drug/metabolite transporter (DMT)-like permease
MLAVAAGAAAAMAAIFAKFASPEMRWEVRMGCYGGVLACNVAMWTLYVQSLTLLSSLQATCFNFAANFLLSGLAGFLLFGEAAHFQWLFGASLIVMGITVLSNADASVEATKSQIKQE